LSRYIDGTFARRAVGLIFLLAAAALPLFRQRGTPSWETVWAEDGFLYTQQAVNRGAFHVVLRGYNGYLQLPPRLLALPTPLFSLRYLALYCSLTSVAVAALLAWGVYHWSRSWIGSRLLRLALASLVVLMPALGTDSTATITNLIWPFLAALPWALISMEERRRDVATRSVVAALGATSSLLSLCFLPLALVWLAYRRTKAALVVTASFVAGIVLQGVVALTTSTPADPLVAHRSLANLVNVVEGEGARGFGTFLLGSRWEMDLGSLSGTAAVVLPTIAVVALLVLLALGADRRVQVIAGTCVVTAVALFAGTAWERGPGVYGLSQAGVSATPRYSVAPVMLVASAVALLVACREQKSNPPSRIRRPLGNAGTWLFVAQTVLVVAAGFSVVTLRGLDPSWIGRVDHVVAQQCANQPPSTLVTVPNGTGEHTFFSQRLPNGVFPVTVPCSHLR
jgi:hypothetical protein